MNSRQSHILRDLLQRQQFPSNLLSDTLAQAFHEVIAPPNDRIEKWYVASRLDLDESIAQQRIPMPLLMGSHMTTPAIPEDSLLRWLRGAQKGVLLVTGPAGAGKTTFVQHFFSRYLLEREPECAQRLCYIRVGLGEALAGCSADMMEKVIDQRIHQTLLETLPELGEPDCMSQIWDTIEPWNTPFYAALRSSLADEEFMRRRLSWMADRMQDLAMFNTARIRFLTERGKDVVLFLDNIDSLDRKSHESVYLIARHKLEWVGAKQGFRVIIAVRDYTYHRFSIDRLDPGYASLDCIYVTSPPLESVLSRRVALLSDVADRLPASNRFTYNNITLDLTPTSIQSCLAALFQGISHPTTTTGILALANFNVRAALSMVGRWVASPWLPWGGVIEASLVEPRPAGFMIPWWMVISGIMTGKDLFYDQYYSPVVNLFQHSGSHLANSILLRIQLLDMVEASHLAPVTRITEMLSEYGHSPMQVEEAVGALLEHGLVQSMDDRLALTRCGAFYRYHLAGSLAYLRLAATDARLDDDLVERVRNVNLRTLAGGARISQVLLEQISRAEDQQNASFRGGKVPPAYGDVYATRRHRPITSNLAHALMEEVKTGLLGLQRQGSPQEIWEIEEVLSRIKSLIQ